MASSPSGLATTPKANTDLSKELNYEKIAKVRMARIRGVGISRARVWVAWEEGLGRR